VLLSSALNSPTKLVVDSSSQKLYWLDSTATKVGCINFDGSGLETWTLPSFGVTTSITIYQVRYDCTVQVANSQLSQLSERMYKPLGLAEVPGITLGQWK